MAAPTPDGIQFNNRVDATTERKLNAKVIDNILNARTFAARLVGMGKEMYGKTFDYPVKIVNGNTGQFFTGLESLNSTAIDSLIVLSFAHTAFTQPAVSIMIESFANAGPQGTIDLNQYKLDEAVAEAIQNWGTAVYGSGAAGQPNGLGNIVDDGTNFATIGGQSRSTFPALKAQVKAASSGLMSLVVLGTLEDLTVASGVYSEMPNLNVTDKPSWTLFESLLTPTMRADYASSGYNVLPLRGNDIVKTPDLKGMAGFTVLAYRGKPVIKDDACTTGSWFMLNERYFEWRGRTVVPNTYQGKIEKVSLGAAKTIDGVAGSPEYRPPSSVGWFYQPYQMLPQQAGMIARYYCIGQVTVSQPRRQGKLTGITTV